MTAGRDVLERIAAALERIAPPVAAPVDWFGAPAYMWDAQGAHAVERIDAVPLAVLRGIDDQKAALTTNLSRHAAGAAAHDMLLWGSRGMGKSALIRAGVADIQRKGEHDLALVQVMPSGFERVSDLLGGLAHVARRFVLFFDDLGFAADARAEMLALRSLLDGGIVPRPANVRIAVTSNHRAIIAHGGFESEALHERDARDDTQALADRFGLKLGFHPCDRETYLAILRAYTDPLGLGFDEEDALAFAIARGNRSGRSAVQYAAELAGRAGIAL
jgi:predicted AAA+ superfamily ATPase